MRLGYTGTSYRYAVHRGHGLVSRDRVMVDGRTTAEYDWRGLPAPYHMRPSAPLAEGSPELSDLARAKSLGLTVVHTVITDWSKTNLDAVRLALQENRQEFVPSVGANVMLEGDLLLSETDRVTRLIHQYAEVGGIKLAKFMVSPMIYNRFRTDPPLSEQLKRLIRALPPIVRAAEEAGIVLALENHLDYRAAEILAVISATNSAHLRFLFDTGNPFAVCEDPVDAARIAAPYTVLMHVKDVRVVPWTPLSTGYFACMYACPLGEGNVDLDAIIDLMAQNAPDAASLTLALEVRPVPPYLDEDHWLEDGIAYMRERFPSHLAATPR